MYNNFNRYRAVGRELIILKHEVFHPQIAAPLESKITSSTLNKLDTVLNNRETIQGLNMKKTLEATLGDSLQVDISRGMVSSIDGGWNDNRYSFMMIVDIYDNNVNRKISEEILQGYTSMQDFTIGNIANGASVRIDPMTNLNINRILQINFRYDEYGRATPEFKKADSLLVNHTTNQHNTNMSLVRPIDMTAKYHANSVSANITSDNDMSIEVSTDSNRYNGVVKLSTSDNEVGGRVISKLVESADMSKIKSDYTSQPKNIALYEDMMNDLMEMDINDYKSLNHISLVTSKTRVSSLTIDEATRCFPGLQLKVSDVYSYNDEITKQTNALFNFNGNTDKGMSSIVDNAINRFQKKLIPFLFDRMMSLGYTQMSGRLTNKTVHGNVEVGLSHLRSVTDTVNNNPEIKDKLYRLLLSSLTDPEANVIVSGGLGSDKNRDVEVVFDLSTTSGTLAISINGISDIVRIPAMCDSLFSTMISTDDNANMFSNDVRNVVDGALGLTKPISYGDSVSVGGVNNNNVVTSTIW